MTSRGAASNPRNRFERLTFEQEAWSGEDPSPDTEFLRDHTRSLIAYNESPDVGFDASVNPYRGCEHGCVYCFARPNHEYLGFSAGLDFESRILVKDDAPRLLREELSHRRWTPKPIALSGVTDPYQPIERRLRLTRGCLEVLAEFRNPALIITKSDLVMRDADLLASMAAWNGIAAFLSVTTLDADLGRRLEPRAAPPARRLAAIAKLAASDVPVGVLAAPMIPGLTDHELPAILQAAGASGAAFAGYIPLRLPHGVGDLFGEWLTLHAPGRKSKVLSRIRSIRGGALNDPNFVGRMRGEGPWAAEMRDLFELGRRRAGLAASPPRLETAHFRVPGSAQGTLFE